MFSEDDLNAILFPKEVMVKPPAKRKRSKPKPKADKKTPDFQLQANRNYRAKNKELTRKSSDRSASKRYIRKQADREELMELVRMIDARLKEMKQDESQN